MLSDDVATTGDFSAIRQGHVLTVARADGTAEHMVVISQTCDVVLPKIPTVVLAKVTTLNMDALARARSGAMPRYVRLPKLVGDRFADMSYVDSYAKEELRDCPYVPGIDMESMDRQREFALAITRWFGRFPFPDDVVPWLRPLEEEIRKKYTGEGALGQLLNEAVVELRVESDWRARPRPLVIHVIVRAEALPTFGETGAAVKPAFAARLRKPDGSVAKPSAVAEVLTSTGDPLERSVAFEALAQSFASVCTPAAKHADDPEVMEAVISVDGKLWADDEFPLSQFRKSEALDLEYLSEPKDD